jgi:hypothetical protein
MESKQASKQAGIVFHCFFFFSPEQEKKCILVKENTCPLL